MTLWQNDPITKQPSVSLTLLLVSFVAALTAAALHLAKVTDNTSTCTELFYSCAALYFGRRFTFKGQSYSQEAAAQVETTVTQVIGPETTTTTDTKQQ